MPHNSPLTNLRISHRCPYYKWPFFPQEFTGFISVSVLGSSLKLQKPISLTCKCMKHEGGNTSGDTLNSEMGSPFINASTSHHSGRKFWKHSACFLEDPCRNEPPFLTIITMKTYSYIAFSYYFESIFLVPLSFFYDNLSNIIYVP